MGESYKADTQLHVVYCDSCIYLRKCRVCCKCAHPKGLKEPQPSIGTFCYYGEEVTNER